MCVCPGELTLAEIWNVICYMRQAHSQITLCYMSTEPEQDLP